VDGTAVPHQQEAELYLVSGASFAVTGLPGVSLPVTAAATIRSAECSAIIHDAGAASYPAFFADSNASTTRTGDLCVMSTNATYGTLFGISASTPFAWGTGGDVIDISGAYRAA
jgi:hypothetical protein